MSSSIVYQAIKSTELQPDNELRSFVWHSLERTFGQLPISLGTKMDVYKLEALEAALDSYRFVNKRPYQNGELNPFGVLINQIRQNGCVRVWVKHEGMISPP